MTSKTRTSTAESTTEDTTTGVNGVGMPGRQQLANLADATSTLLRASESLQQAQQHMVQRAALVQQQAADKLRKASNPADLWAIQAELMMLSVTESAQYIGELASATLKLQSDMMKPTGTAQAVTANPAASMLQAWQQMFSAPLNGSSAVHAQ